MNLRFIIIAILSSFAFLTEAQNVAINTTGGIPDGSAMLDISSTTKGLLIPRMSTIQRTGITSPATGLMVYDEDTKSFWYYDDTTWVELLSSSDDFDWEVSGSDVFTGHAAPYPTGNVGIGTATPLAKLHVDDDGAILATGTLGSGWGGGALGGGTRLMWIPEKAAFRAGRVTGARWDWSNIGDYSTATGYRTVANAGYTIAMGRMSQATGNQSVAMGYQAIASGETAVSLGDGTNASGINATALGSSTAASGDYSTAIGYQTTASAIYATAIGYQSSATGRWSFAGGEATSSGDYSFAYGSGDAAAYSSIVMGYNNNTTASYAIAMGSGNNADGESSIAMGKSSTASADFAIAMGEGCSASGQWGVALGYNATASGPLSSTALGRAVTASGNSSFAAGFTTTASGSSSISMGDRTSATADKAVAIGMWSEAVHESAFVFGRGSGNADRFTSPKAHSFSIGFGKGAADDPDFMVEEGLVGIGTSAPTAQFHTTGSLRFQGAGMPAAGRVLTSDANGNATWQAPSVGGADFDWEISGNDVFTGHGGSYPSGNVGIGTTSPVYKLDVESNMGIGYRIYGNDGNTGTNGTYIEFGGTNDDNMKIRVNGEEYWSYDQGAMLANFNAIGHDIDMQIEGLTDQYLLYVNAGDERVGVGTSSPMVKTQINESAGQSLMLVRDDTYITTDNQLGGIGFDGRDGNVPDDIKEASASIIAFASEYQGIGDKGGYLTFYTSPTNQNDDTDGLERMRIESDGYVGIGTTNPNQQLHVSNNVQIDGGIHDGTDFGTAGQVLTTDGSGDISWQAASGGDNDWEVSGNNIFTGHGGSYPSGGYLGIGTATPTKLVHIIGDDSSPEEFVIEDEGGGTYSYLHTCIRNKTGSGSMSYSFSQQGGNMHFAGIDLDPDNEQLIIRNNYCTTNGFDNGVITFKTRNAGGTGERMRVDNDGNLGIAASIVRTKLHIAGGIGIGASGSTGLSTTHGAKNSIQMNTDTYYGGVNDEHPGYLIYSANMNGWNTAELLFCTSNNWGTYATGTPALRVTQTATYANGTALTSDKRLKKDVENNPYGLSTVMKMKSLKYKKQIVDSIVNGEFIFNKNIAIDEVGFFAQDLYKIIPEVVHKPTDENKETWAIDYSKLVPVLTKALQEEDQKVEQLELKIEEQEKIIEKLSKSLNKIELLEKQINELKKSK